MADNIKAIKFNKTLMMAKDEDGKPVHTANETQVCPLPLMYSSIYFKYNNEVSIGAWHHR